MKHLQSVFVIQFQNGMHMPLMMSSLQDFQPQSWFPTTENHQNQQNQQNQQMMLLDESNILPHRWEHLTHFVGGNIWNCCYWFYMLLHMIIPTPMSLYVFSSYIFIVIVISPGSCTKTWSGGRGSGHTIRVPFEGDVSQGTNSTKSLSW